jgi:NAD-dependent SIR2 family protein deacetylase
MRLIYDTCTHSLCTHRALQAQPNAAHALLAKLSVPKYLQIVAPAAKSFHLITQNVDGLSVAALKSLAEQLPNNYERLDRVQMESLIQMHGSLFDVVCTKCGHTAQDLSNPLNPSLGAADLLLDDYVDAGSKKINIAMEDLPRCSLCGALARPGVVWFDEKPYKLDEINNLIFKADLCLVIGTSSTVRADDCNFFLVNNLLGSLLLRRYAQHRHMHIALNVAVEKWRCSMSSIAKVKAMLTLSFGGLVRFSCLVYFRSSVRLWRLRL